MKATALILITGVLLATVSPAAAQWTQVADVPTTSIYSVWANGDTLTATADSVVYVSTNGGATWKDSVPVAPGVTSVQGARVHNGLLYAGTFGQGVFVSDDLGDTWVAFNQGLVGGFLDTQLFIGDLLLDDNKLYAATSGDGPWARSLSPPGTWTHFSNIFEPNQSSNMNDIAAGGTRLFACAGFNGNAFFRNAGDSDWTITWLNNVGIVPGLAGLSAIWNGSRWIVGANTGVYYSAQGQSPWTFTDLGLGTLLAAVFALRSPDVFAAFGTGIDAVVAYSGDGISWNVLETLPFTFFFGLATHDNTLYAARADGLWRRSIATVATKPITWGQVKSLYRGPRN